MSVWGLICNLIELPNKQVRLLKNPLVVLQCGTKRTLRQSRRTILQAPTSAADPCSVTLIQSVNNRIRRAKNARNPRRNIVGQAEGELKFLSVSYQ